MIDAMSATEAIFTARKEVQREVHPMKTVEENLAKLKGSAIYTKLDANSGFWQIPLDEESGLLTTFVTPFGRFCHLGSVQLQRYFSALCPISWRASRAIYATWTMS